LLYISRSKAHLLPVNQTARRRNILNEQAVGNALVPIGFEAIHLEDYPLVDKIRLFQSAKMIVTPSGGALTMCFFANQNTQIIEIIGADSQNEDQYYHICEVLSIPIVRYTNVKSLDYNGNIVTPVPLGLYNIEVPDVDDLVKFVVAKKDI
jgi:capsular polysaccharide biosynthesis protein